MPSDVSVSYSNNGVFLVDGPLIALTAPANGTVFPPLGTINLAASVTYTNGHSITRVQFYNGATLLGQASSAPYTFAWASVSPGSYTLSAQVIYDSGSIVTSAPVSVTVIDSNTYNNYASHVMFIPNLLGYWRFDPVFQTNSCVNGYTGTLQGNAQIGAAGSGCPLASDQTNQALLLDGVNSYLTTSLTGQIPSQGTILVWVYLTAQPSTAGHIFAIVSQSQGGNDFDFQIETDNHTKFYAGGVTVYSQALPLNQWHFLAATLSR